MVSLVVGVPLLIGCLWYSRRGSPQALLVWAGTLFYFAYSYYFYVVGGFNALFLVYVFIVAASLYALLALLFRIDGDAVRALFADRGPARVASGLFLVVALLFTLLWGGMSASSAAAGTEPDAVLHSVVAVDLVVLLPALYTGGLMLWVRRSWGYVLGGVLLTKLALTGGTLAFTTLLNGLWGQPVGGIDAFLGVIFVTMLVAAAALLVPFLGAMAGPARARVVEAGATT